MKSYKERIMNTSITTKPAPRPKPCPRCAFTLIIKNDGVEDVHYCMACARYFNRQRKIAQEDEADGYNIGTLKHWSKKGPNSKALDIALIRGNKKVSFTVEYFVSRKNAYIEAVSVSDKREFKALPKRLRASVVRAGIKRVTNCAGALFWLEEAADGPLDKALLRKNIQKDRVTVLIDHRSKSAADMQVNIVN